MRNKMMVAPMFVVLAVASVACSRSRGYRVQVNTAPAKVSVGRVRFHIVGVCGIKNDITQISNLDVYMPPSPGDNKSVNVTDPSDTDSVIPHHSSFIRFERGSLSSVDNCGLSAQDVNNDPKEQLQYVELPNGTDVKLISGILDNTQGGAGAPIDSSTIITMTRDAGSTYAMSANITAGQMNAIWHFGRQLLQHSLTAEKCWAIQSYKTSQPQPQLGTAYLQEVAFGDQLDASGQLHFDLTNPQLPKGSCTITLASGGNLELYIGNTESNWYAREPAIGGAQKWDTHFEMYYGLTTQSAKGAPLPHMALYCGEGPGGMNCPPVLF